MTNDDEKIILTIGEETFMVSKGFLECLDEIAIMSRLQSKAHVLQNAVTLLYFLSRERHENDAVPQIQYPNGRIVQIQYWKEVKKPVMTKTNSMQNTPKSYSEFEHYRKPIKELNSITAQAVNDE